MESVKIGKQEWSTENLNVDHFNNGDEIQQIESAADWLMHLKEKKPAWCYYENDASNLLSEKVIYLKKNIKND